MRRFLPVLLLLFLCLFFSCSTTIGVSYLQPAAIDMGGYRNLAIASVIPYHGYVAPRYVVGADIHVAGFHVYSGYSEPVSRSIASYATDELVSTLASTRFFNILSPDVTDRVLDRGRFGEDISATFKSMGYDAVLIPRITGMSVSESVYSKPYEEWWVDSDGERHRRIEFNYYYNQIASIDYTLTIIDTETGHIVGQRTYSDTETREGTLDRRWSHLEDVSYLFRRMIRSFNSPIIRLLVPTEREYSVSLMKNKPENGNVERAYDAAKDGFLAEAEAIFEAEWNESHHLPSGYNAALLLAASGDYDAAIDLLGDITTLYSNEDARLLYRDLMAIRTSNEQAIGQVTGESSVQQSGLENNNGVYAMVMGL